MQTAGANLGHNRKKDGLSIWLGSLCGARLARIYRRGLETKMAANKQNIHSKPWPQTLSHLHTYDSLLHRISFGRSKERGGRRQEKRERRKEKGKRRKEKEERRKEKEERREKKEEKVKEKAERRKTEEGRRKKEEGRRNG